MINTAKLRGLMAEKKISGRAMAKVLNIHEQTFYSKMQKGKFDSDEMQAFVDVLDIANPAEIFFARECTSHVQNED